MLATPFAPSDPMVTIFRPIEQLRTLAETAKIPYTESQIVNFGIQLIKSTRDFETALGEWNRKDEKDSGDVSSKKRGAKKAKKKEESDTSDSEDEGGVVTYIPHILAICIEPAATATYFTAASTAGISTSNAARAACYADDDAT